MTEEDGGDVAAVSVLVSADKLASLGDVVAELQKKGMNVDQVLDLIGVVNGTVPRGQLDELRSVPGVSAVEEQRAVRNA